MDTIKEMTIEQMLYELHLRHIRSHYKEYLEQMADEHLDYVQWLRMMLEGEYRQRQETCQTNRMKTAGFPQFKYLSDLVRQELPSGAQAMLPELETLDFVRKGRNVIMFGNPGTGKTHLAIALGIEACKQRMSVLFTSIPHLITQLKECKSEKTLHTFELRFKRYDLVICDEFGYISCDKEGGELLFNLLSLRAGVKSTIVTTNLAFDRWSEVIKDKVLVAALVDRLTHHAFLLNMSGKSYRLKETLGINS